MSQATYLLLTKASTWKSSPMRWAVGGWSLFIMENLILSENRTSIINALGSDDGYHYLYGTMSTIAIASIGYGYRRVKDTSPILWTSLKVAPPRGNIVAAFIFQGLALVMASQIAPKMQIPLHFVRQSEEEEEEIIITTNDIHNQKNSTLSTPSSSSSSSSSVPLSNKSSGKWTLRCPFDFADAKLNQGPNNNFNNDTTFEPYGLQRITRHPGLWSFGLFSFGNALLIPSLPAATWMAMPLVVAWIGSTHIDSRHIRGIGGSLSNDVLSKTSNVPFMAMITTKTIYDLKADSFEQLIHETKVLNATLGLGLAALSVGMRRGRVSALRSTKLSR